MEPNISDGMCRCCASEGSSKDIQTTYHWMGVEEIYSDMLKDCFNITLATSEVIHNGGICELCISQLRNAYNFKRQVQVTEEQFKKKVRESVFESSSIKLEISQDDVESDNVASENLSDADYEVPIKEEKQEEKPKKRQAKASTSKAKKTKTEGETSKRLCATKKQVIKIEPKEEKNHKEIKLVAIKKLSGYQNDVQKHRANMKEILESSNATPIRGHSDSGYACNFCINQYSIPSDLKTHNLESHANNLSIKDLEALVSRDLNQVCIKLDITALACTICLQNMDSVEELISHLQTVHNKNIFTDIKQQTLSFKFDTENLQCHICKKSFNKFKKLMEHMNIHFSNFICDICDAGFVNKRKLHYHKTGHGTGNFACDICLKVFTTYPRKRSHEKQYHEKARLVNKCGYCNALFKCNRQKDQHLVSEHGVTSFARKCQACDKMFVHQHALQIHMRRYHLVERPHKCSECDKGFFSSSELRTHMVKHTGQREYKCEVCPKSYARRWSLRQHMRIHADDSRYECEHCSQIFVLKFSWRNHMRVKHGEEV